jgi:hypothetical protein
MPRDFQRLSRQTALANVATTKAGYVYVHYLQIHAALR